MIMNFNNPYHQAMHQSNHQVGQDQMHQQAALHHDEEYNSEEDDDDSNDGKMGSVLYMGNIAAACDAANAATQKPFRTDVEKQEERRAANRRSAKMSRDRKKMERDQLQEKATRLAQANLALTKENQELRQQIATLISRQGGRGGAGGGGGAGGRVEKPPSSLPNLQGVLGGMDGNAQDLLTLQWMQQHAQAEQQKKRNVATLSMGNSMGFGDLMAPAALVQASQLASQTRQLNASSRNQHQHQHHQGLNMSDTNALALGFAPGGLARAFDKNKRQKLDPNDFM